MIEKKTKNIGLIFFCAVLLYGLHKWVVMPLLPVSTMLVSLELLYLVFSVSSVLLYIGVAFVAKKNYHYIGMGFLGGITLKMILFLAVFKPMLNRSVATENEVEKISFIVVFLIFLLMDVVLGTKILRQYSKI